MNDTIEARVARGAEFMDRYQPGWERAIDATALDIASCSNCILGQAAGVASRSAGYMPHSHADCGFQPTAWPWDEGQGRAECDALGDAWIALIKERFASGLLSDEAAS